MHIELDAREQTENSGWEPASIKDSHKEGGLRSGPPTLWEAAESRLLYGGWVSAYCPNLARMHFYLYACHFVSKPYGVRWTDPNFYPFSNMFTFVERRFVFFGKRHS